MDLPDDLEYGYALGFWIEAWGDSPSDPDRLPDRRPSTGTVKITPASTFITSTAEGPVAMGVLPKTQNCTLGPNGELLDEAGAIGVWLITGRYRVVINIVGSSVLSYDILVTTAHTEQAPLDLVLAMPLVPGVTERFVVNQQVYVDTLAAAVRAEAAAEAAENAAGGGGPRVTSVAGRNGDVVLTKNDVGLSQVDNTPDSAKPISEAQGEAFGLRAMASRKVSTGAGLQGGGDLTADLVLSLADAVTASLARADSAVQPAGLTKAAVGLGSVDNTSDAAKPLSTAAVTALAGKAPLASPTFTGTVSGISKSMVGLANVDNTSDANKPVSTATASALAGKAATAHTHVAADITDASTSGKTLLTQTDLGLARAAINAADAGVSVLPGTGLTGGGNLTQDRTLGLNAATQSSLAKADTAVQPAGLTKAAVGLGNVDNTADTAKPVSTAQQTALNAKAPIASPTFTGTVGGVTAAMTGAVANGGGAVTMRVMTQAAYTALATKDANTIYWVTG